ncbi:hypothetical protein C9374_002911 [Naegleria lovaniensis]|uniref:Uncharacterized protein n=1 Tax=Naegleria lovaniensis TaxID=51637 RepID=A0AA88GN70_NAELO|nr:uncharacterized protein C9374_002911 [Naegleria lovaniensis]KAG2385762.1 hypothetical protein C9374_002911 [Naegleria lovaniensis]
MFFNNMNQSCSRCQSEDTRIITTALYHCNTCNLHLCGYHGQNHGLSHSDHHVKKLNASSPGIVFENNSQPSNFFSRSAESTTTPSFSWSTPSSTSLFSSSLSSSSSSSLFSSSSSSSFPFSFGDSTQQISTENSVKKINEITQVKLLLVGDGAVGKSLFVSRLRNIQFNTIEYKPTMGVEVFDLDFETIAHGPIRVSIWDTAGQEKFGGLRDGYYISGQCALIMYDMKYPQSLNSVPHWHRDISRVCANIPIAVCANKSDLMTNDNEVESMEQRAQMLCARKQMKRFTISAKEDSLEKLQQVIESMIQDLKKDPTLKFLSIFKLETETRMKSVLYAKTQTSLQTDVILLTRDGDNSYQ